MQTFHNHKRSSFQSPQNQTTQKLNETTQKSAKFDVHPQPPFQADNINLTTFPPSTPHGNPSAIDTLQCVPFLCGHFFPRISAACLWGFGVECVRTPVRSVSRRRGNAGTRPYPTKGLLARPGSIKPFRACAGAAASTLASDGPVDLAAAPGRRATAALRRLRHPACGVLQRPFRPRFCGFSTHFSGWHPAHTLLHTFSHRLLFSRGQTGLFSIF